MNKKSKTKFYYGIYLYAGQVQLSIDRGYRGDHNELILYFREKTSPLIIAEKLDNIFEGKLSGDKFDQGVRPLDRPMILRLKRFFIAEIPLVHAYYIHKKLLTLKNFIDGKGFSTQELLKVRWHFVCISEYMRLEIFPPWMREKYCIEHYNQNEMLDCRSIEEIAGVDWLS